MQDFDPNNAATTEGLFGLSDEQPALVRVLPVPIDATVSFMRGTADSWKYILRASHQVDLFHPHVESPWQEGIVLEDVPSNLRWLNTEACALVGAARSGAACVDEVNKIGEVVADETERFVSAAFEHNQIPAILGGDHSVPFGAHKAAAAQFDELGILHIDAHADLRPAYEGFTHSHASIFHNTMSLDISSLAQVGIRDLCEVEAQRQRDDPRIHALTDFDIADTKARGADLKARFVDLVETLPESVWVSVDIDGLDPSLCPNTGTPVPGGLSWREFRVLMQALGESNKNIVGFDLCEVGPHPWDANVGARVLFELWCWSVSSYRRRSRNHV
tara:strand:- start:1236 stop:2231 length:996 start_codon:yes stop_codon:yes gene_type:complete